MNAISWPNAPCCTPGREHHCVCPDMERALRAWKGGDDMPSMTQEQRAACLDEIEQVEGWRRSDHEHLSDKDLASDVLSAWLDYCRDKGLMD